MCIQFIQTMAQGKYYAFEIAQSQFLPGIALKRVGVKNSLQAASMDQRAEDFREILGALLKSNRAKRQS